MATNNRKPPDQTDPDMPSAADYSGKSMHPLLDTFGFWCFVWLGTTAAGGLFGLLVGCFAVSMAVCILGILVGCIVAGVCAVPVVVTVAVLTWAMWLSRFRVLVAGLVGGLTGLIATGFMSSPGVSLFGAGAGLLGMFGGSFGGRWYNKKISRLGQTSSNSNLQPWQCTLRDLFARMTVLAMLISAWTWTVKSIYHARQEAIRAEQEYDAQPNNFND